MRISTNQYQQVSLRAILDQQSRLSRVQEQLATGRRILQPSDDPSGSARALELAKSIETIERYNRNIDFADSRMRVEESALTEVGNVIQRVRELAIQAANDSTTAEDRQKIGAEVRERFDQLLQLANSTDGNGEYLFAGLKSREQPFVDSGGEVSYVGDQATRSVQVGPGRQAVTTHSGFEVFMKIPNGDGERFLSADPANSGTGTLGGAEVTDPAALTGDDYEIRFSTTGGTLEYEVENTTTSSIVAGPQAFDADSPVAFDGLSVDIDGTPDDGDSFTVQPSEPQSLFRTVERLAASLEGASGGATARAEFRNTVNATLDDLDQALENTLEIRAELGGRLNGLENDRSANEAAVLELKETKSGIEDLNYADAATRLNQRLAGLQAAQQSYTKIQGLSLFNYL